MGSLRVIGVKGMAGLSQMLARMKPIDNLHAVREEVIGQIPNPCGSISGDATQESSLKLACIRVTDYLLKSPDTLTQESAAILLCQEMGEEAYLEPYRSSLAGIDRLNGELRRMARTGELQPEKVERVISLSELKLAEQFLTSESPEPKISEMSPVAIGQTDAKKAPTSKMTPLNQWERYTQVVLLTNELIFLN